MAVNVAMRGFVIFGEPRAATTCLGHLVSASFSLGTASDGCAQVSFFVHGSLCGGKSTCSLRSIHAPLIIPSSLHLLAAVAADSWPSSVKHMNHMDGGPPLWRNAYTAVRVPDKLNFGLAWLDALRPLGLAAIAALRKQLSACHGAVDGQENFLLLPARPQRSASSRCDVASILPGTFASKHQRR